MTIVQGMWLEEAIRIVVKCRTEACIQHPNTPVPEPVFIVSVARLLANHHGDIVASLSKRQCNWAHKHVTLVGRKRRDVHSERPSETSSQGWVSVDTTSKHGKKPTGSV